jgi:hypothetical protein
MRAQSPKGRKSPKKKYHKTNGGNLGVPDTKRRRSQSPSRSRSGGVGEGTPKPRRRRSRSRSRSHEVERGREEGRREEEAVVED